MYGPAFLVGVIKDEGVGAKALMGRKVLLFLLSPAAAAAARDDWRAM